MRLFALITLLASLGLPAWAEPKGKWANLDRYPSCNVAFNFRSNGTVDLPDIRNPQKIIVANWRMQNNTIIISEDNKKWESYYSFRNNKIVWLSIKTLGKTQNITNQYSLSERTLRPCP